MKRKNKTYQKISVICPNCSRSNVVKRGRRKTKYANKQLYFCKGCQKRFTDQDAKYMMYSPQVIYHALNIYHLGYNLKQTSKQVNRKFKVKTSKSTIYYWIHKYKKFCPISSMKNSFSKNDDVLFSKHFEHENLDYLFMYHKYKLKILACKNFEGLKKYIQSFERGCPDVFFKVGKRCSEPIFKVEVNATRKMNLACKMATFALQACRKNLDRHKLVEKFMLICDKATIACEVPVWYWDKKIDEGITGHIDLIQLRNNLVYMLDYKPNATNDKKAANQLYHYASALCYRAKVPLEKIRCAWFDEESYFEYAPHMVKFK